MSTRLRGRLRRLRLAAAGSGERGSTSVQMVILMPVLFSVMFLGLQAALFYHARTVAIAAAQEGARAAGAETGIRQRRHRGRHIVRGRRRRIGRVAERLSVRQPLSHPGERDCPRRRVERHPRLVPDRAAERHRPRRTDHHRMSQQTRQTNRERGSATIEAVIGVPAFLLFVLLIIAAGRIAIARQAVEASAAEAARSASIARTQGQAEANGVSGAAASLRNQGVRCTAQRVDVDTSGFAAPVGTPATVTATVTCIADLSDLSIPGLPGSRTITATMSSPIDTYRER